MSVTNPFPLEIDYSLLEGGRPNEEQWEEIRSFMREERREKSVKTSFIIEDLVLLGRTRNGC